MIDSTRKTTQYRELCKHTLKPPVPKHGDQWGDWRFDAHNWKLILPMWAPDYAYTFTIDLRELKDAAAILRTILLYDAKPETEPGDVLNLVYAIADILRPATSGIYEGKVFTADDIQTLLARNCGLITHGEYQFLQRCSA